MTEKIEKTDLNDDVQQSPTDEQIMDMTIDITVTTLVRSGIPMERVVKGVLKLQRQLEDYKRNKQELINS